MTKSLISYYADNIMEEISSIDEVHEYTVYEYKVISESQAQRKEIYRIRDELKSSGVLEEFSYTGKTKDDKAYAVITVSDNSTLEEIFINSSESLTFGENDV